MKSIIQSIFTAAGFQTASEDHGFLFYENNTDGLQSYFLVHFLPIAQTKGYMDSDTFSVLQDFFELQKLNKGDVEKNTSLLILAEATDIKADFAEFKNSILELEEDEFWFKKYVLVYNQLSTEDFESSENILADLHNCILNNTKFTAFKDDLFADVKYFFAMQVYLKLPFLTVPISLNEQLLSIESILSTNLDTLQLGFMELIVSEFDQIPEGFWDNIKEQSVKKDDSAQLQEFLTKFGTDDQNT